MMTATMLQLLIRTVMVLAVVVVMLKVLVVMMTMLIVIRYIPHNDYTTLLS